MNSIPLPDYTNLGDNIHYQWILYMIIYSWIFVLKNEKSVTEYSVVNPTEFYEDKYVQ